MEPPDLRQELQTWCLVLPEDLPNVKLVVIYPPWWAVGILLEDPTGKTYADHLAPQVRG